MEIVINISEEMYNMICNAPFVFKSKLDDAIRNGTQLPKGHGRMIDADEFEKIVDNKFEHITSPLLNHIQSYDVYNLLEATPTIIEADKEEK